VTEPDLADEWRVEIQPALTQLATYLRHRPMSERPVLVPIGDDQLEVTPAECALVLKAGGGSVTLARHLHLFCDSIGLRAKLLSAEAEHAHAGGEARTDTAALLRYDVGIGHRLIHAMQGEMGALMAAGRVEEARRLADHRGRVSAAVQRALHAIGEDHEEHKHSSGPHSRSDGGAAAGHPRSPSHRPAQRPTADSRRILLTRVASVVLVVVLVVVLMQLYANRERDLPAVSSADLAAVPGVQLVVCRSPEVVVVVSEQVWAKLDLAAKREAVEAAGRAVEHLGYRRVEFRTMKRSGLAEWLRGGKVRIGD